MKQPEDEFAQARKQMVEYQLRHRGIKNERVLTAMHNVRRHLFLTQPSSPGAYDDHPLPIGAGQTISQPYMVALMTECLELSGTEKVLEIGTGSGYQTAILAELSAQVYSIERIPALADHARQILQLLGYQNVQVMMGDGTLGWPEFAPYDRILVTAGTPGFCQPWVDQLAEGGIVVAPIGDRYSQTLVVGTKAKGKLLERMLCGCVFVPLIGQHGWEA